MQQLIASLDFIGKMLYPFGMQKIQTTLAPWQPRKPRITVEHVASLLMKNYNQSQIARLSNVSRQYISDFIALHYEVLQPLIDNTDTVLALRLKHKGIEILNSIDMTDIKKASLLQKATAFGIMADKYKLLQSHSTGDSDKDIVIHIHNNLFTHVATNVATNPDTSNNKMLDTIDVND